MSDKKTSIIITITVLLVAISAIASIFFGGEYFALFSCLIAALCVVLMFLTFEKSRQSVRKLCAIAVMTALSVASRMLFAPLGGFKPVSAVVIFCAMYFGAQAGMVCGCFSALISNFYFGQGPWTPIQMLTWGLIGLVAGLLAEKLKKSYVWLTIYAALSGVIYSLILDVWSVQWYSGAFNLKLYFSALIASLPFTVMYMISNVLFLLLLQRLCAKNMQRIVAKYM